MHTLHRGRNSDQDIHTHTYVHTYILYIHTYITHNIKIKKAAERQNWMKESIASQQPLLAGHHQDSGAKRHGRPRRLKDGATFLHVRGPPLACSPCTARSSDRSVLGVPVGAPPHTGQSSSSSSLAFLDSSATAAAAGATTLPRQSGHVAWSRSQAPTQSAWNRCPHRGRTRTESPSRSSTMHTAHSGAFPPPPPSPAPAPALEYTDTGSDDATSSTGVDCGAPWPSCR